MRKTKKEKLAAVARRKVEFEKIKLSLNLEIPPRASQALAEEVEKFSPKIKTDETLLNLTNLSYLPKQMAKIGIVTIALVLVQVLLSFILL